MSDNTHTSYTDILDISVSERMELINCIQEKIKAQNEAMEKQIRANKNY